MTYFWVVSVEDDFGIFDPFFAGFCWSIAWTYLYKLRCTQACGGGGGGGGGRGGGGSGGGRGGGDGGGAPPPTPLTTPTSPSPLLTTLCICTPRQRTRYMGDPLIM